MKRFALLLVLLLPAREATAAPPDIEIPPAVVAPTNGYLIVKPKTTAVAAVSVEYDAPGLDPFPNQFLNDKLVLIIPVRGVQPGNYRCVAVAASATGEQRKIEFFVRFGGPTLPPLPPPGPPDPPVIPPVTGSLYFAVIRADGPAAPAFTRTMSDPAWDTLRMKGHSVKDFTVSRAAVVGLPLVENMPLPAVVTLRQDGAKHVVVRGPVPLPTAPADILKLPEGVR